MKFLKKYKDLILIYVLYAMALAFIFSQNGCASHFKALKSDNTVVIKKKTPQPDSCDQLLYWIEDFHGRTRR